MEAKTTPQVHSSYHWRRGHNWQAFGYYDDAPADAFVGNDAKPMFASPCRASNAFMAEWRILRNVFPYAPVITSLKES